MSKRKNYPKVVAYLEAHNIPFEAYNGGQHLKIAGPTAQVQLWPSRMTYHIMQSENPTDNNKYGRLSLHFDEHELKEIL